MVSFKSRTIQEFLAAMKLVQLPPEQLRKYAQVGSSLVTADWVIY